MWVCCSLGKIASGYVCMFSSDGRFVRDNIFLYLPYSVNARRIRWQQLVFDYTTQLFD